MQKKSGDLPTGNFSGVSYERKYAEIIAYNRRNARRALHHLGACVIVLLALIYWSFKLFF